MGIASQQSTKAITSQSNVEALTLQPSMEVSQPSLAIETISHHSEPQKPSLQIDNKSDSVSVRSESQTRKAPRGDLDNAMSRDPRCTTPSRKKLYDDPSFESSQPVNLCKTVTNNHLQINSG